MSELKKLIELFPDVDLPITLTDESIDIIRTSNDVLPSELIDLYIDKWEGMPGDEFTEFVPCLKFGRKDKVYCLIYWKASLLKYEFILVTIDEHGNLISRKPICGTIVDGDIIKKSVASIDEEFTIHIVAGANHKDVIFDAQHSQSFSMEIFETGEISFMDND